MHKKVSLIQNLIKDLNDHADQKRAAGAQRYFKTGKGEYGEGDIFLGLSTPVMTKIVKNYLDLDFQGLQKLLESKIHEYRSVALVILVNRFRKAKGNHELKKEIVSFYLKNSKNINNWDLVDISAPTILGEYLLENNDKSLLDQLAKSDLLWERRMAILATFAFIKEHKFNQTLRISKKLLNDKHDLIHKAVGWALREVGKKEVNILEKFLKENLSGMPRTTLRYAIEKFSDKKRKEYLSISL